MAKSSRTPTRVAIEKEDIHIARSVRDEADIIGVICAKQDPRFVLDLSERLYPTDFLRKDHQILYRATTEVARHDAGEGFSPELLARRIEPQDLEMIGGVDWIRSYFNNGYPDVSIEREIRRVLNDSRRRKALQIADRLQRATSAEEFEPGEIERRTIEELKALTARFDPVDEPIVEPFTGFYEGIAALTSQHSEMPEQIIHGGPRGQVVEIVAPPDGGKSTLMLNVSLCLAAGIGCPPLASSPSKAMRVLYLDFESTAAELSRDVNTMILQIDEHEARKLAMTNFLPVVDATRNGDPLSLSDSDHMTFVTEWARNLNVDLIVVDTVSSGFEIVSENDNSEVRNRVMRPLRHLAHVVGALIVFLHHDSKATELESDEGSYRGRGASAFGALSRAVFTLKKESVLGEGFVTLKQRKGKGVKLQSHLLQIDLQKRWATISNNTVPRFKSSYELVLDAVGDETLAAGDIVTRLKGKVSRSAVFNSLKEAANRGDLFRSKRGLYSKSTKSTRSRDDLEEADHGLFSSP